MAKKAGDQSLNLNGICDDIRLGRKPASDGEAPVNYESGIKNGNINLAKCLPSAGEGYSVAIQCSRDEAGNVVIHKISAVLLNDGAAQENKE